MKFLLFKIEYIGRPVFCHSIEWIPCPLVGIVQLRLPKLTQLSWTLICLGDWEKFVFYGWRRRPALILSGVFYGDNHMVEQEMPNAEMLRVILEELKELRQEFRDHITDENIEFEKIRNTLHSIDMDQALTKQRVNLTTAGIAVVASGLFTYFLSVIGVSING
jgi:hypothetical protein